MDSYRNINERTRERTRSTGQGVRKRSARFVSAILALSMVMSLFVMPQIAPSTAEAASMQTITPENVEYHYGSGKYQFSTSGTYDTDEGIMFEGVCYVHVPAGVTVTIPANECSSPGIGVGGWSERNSTLYLVVDGTLNVYGGDEAHPGIGVYEGATLYIGGSGKVNAYGHDAVEASAGFDYIDGGTGAGAGIGSAGSYVPNEDADNYGTIYIVDNVTIYAVGGTGSDYQIIYDSFSGDHVEGETSNGYGIGSGSGGGSSIRRTDKNDEFGAPIYNRTGEGTFGSGKIYINNNAKLGSTTTQSPIKGTYSMPALPSKGPSSLITGLKAEAESSSSVTLSWDKTNDADFYEVSYSKSGTYTRTDAGTTTSTAFTVAGLEAGTQYTFYVYPANLAASGSGSSVTKQTLCAAPGKPTVEAAGNGQIKVSWSPVTGASKYRVYYGQSSNAATYEDESNTTHIFSNLNAGTTYYFRVAAFNGDNVLGAASAENSTAARAVTYSNKTMTAAAYGTSYSQSVANTTGGSSSYTYTLESGSTLPAGLTLNSNGTLSGTPTATAGQTYTFTVRATDKTYTACSDTATVSLTINASNPGTPTDVTAESGYNSVKLKWSAPSSDGDGKGDLSYKIYWGTNSNNLNQTKTTKNLEETFSGLASGTNYYFRVSAINKSNKEGSKSSMASARPYSDLKYNNEVVEGYGVLGQNKTLNFPTPTNGSGTYTYELVYGSLPAGMSLNKSKGQIIGTPRESGVFEVDIKATDAVSGNEAIATITFGVATKDTFNGSGTEADPYLIETEEDLWNFTIKSQSDDSYNKHFKLMKDMDLNPDMTITAESTEAKKWLPIGASGQSFCGSFDGNHHTISGLYCVSKDSVALFGYIGNPEYIKNVGVINSYFESTEGSAAAIAVKADYLFNIDGCYNEATVKAATWAAGIFANSYEDMNIKNCYNKGNIIGKYVAGIAAGCTSDENDGYCTTVANCYNTGILNGSERIGEILTGVTGGYNENYPKLTNNYYLSSSHTDNGGRTEAEMKAPEFVSQLGGKKGAWFMDVADADGNYKNDGYPVLRPSFNGEGTEEAPYEISSAAELQAFSAAVNGGWDTKGKYFVLTNDIDLNPGKTITAESTDAVKWQPIKVFKGSFDGGYHTIAGIYCKTGPQAGLFGVAEGATIKNTGVINSYIESDYMAGGISASYGTISSCYNEATVVGSYEAGGISGAYARIENCYNKGLIIGNDDSNDGTGGILGYDAAADVSNSYNLGIVRNPGNPSNAGAVVGYSDDDDNTRIENCYYLNTSCEGHNSYSGTAKTAEELKAPEMIKTLDNGKNIWYAGGHTNDGYPILGKPSYEGEGTEANPYLIKDETDLRAFSADCYKGRPAMYDTSKSTRLMVRLENDIDLNPGLDLSTEEGRAQAREFTPIGGFNGGDFEGNGHVISGLYIPRYEKKDTDSSLNQSGIGLLTDGTGDRWVAINNLGVVNAYVSGESNVGIISGSVHGICYRKVYVRGTVKGNDKVGGIIGSETYGIDNPYSLWGCYAAVDIELGDNPTDNYGSILGSGTGENKYLSTAFEDKGYPVVWGTPVTSEAMKSSDFIDIVDGRFYKQDKTLLNDGYPIFASAVQNPIPITVNFDEKSLSQDFNGEAKPVTCTVTNSSGKKLPITSDEYTLTYNGKAEAPIAPGEYDVVFTLNEGNEYYTLENNKAEAKLNILTYKPSVPKVNNVISKNSSILIDSIEETNEKVTEVQYFTVKVCAPGTQTVVKELTVGSNKIVNKKAENIVIDGLQNGSKYDVYITGTNGIGTGDPFVSQESVQVGMPTTPEGFKLIQKEGKQFDITFKPSDGQGSKIIGYDLIIGGTVAGKPVEETTVTITDKDYKVVNGYIVYPYMAEGRKNGDEVTVQVVAKSETANMKSKPTDKLKGKLGAPDAPVLTNKVDGDGIALSWTEPNTYDNIAQYYTVYITDKNGDKKSFKTANASTLEMRINTGEFSEANKTYPFVRGDSYTVTVTCNNGAEGLPSNADTFTFGTAPQPEPTTEPGVDVGTLNVTWNKPDGEDPNNPITGYIIYLNSGNEYKPHTKVTWEQNDGKYQLYLTDLTKENAEPVAYGEAKDEANLYPMTVTITGLQTGLSYSTKVNAINDITPPVPTPNPSPNPGDPNEDDPIVIAKPADKPTDVNAKGVGGKSVDLNWNEGFYNGGSPVTGYIIEAYKVSEIDYKTFNYNNLDPAPTEPVQTYGSIESPIQGTTYTAGGLEEGYGYKFNVKAVNAAGSSEASDDSNEAYTFTKPSKPTITSIESELGLENPKITVKWDAPEHDGGTQILGYEVMRTAGTEVKSVGQIWYDGETPLGDKLEVTVPSSLNVNGTRYTYTVIAYNAVTGTESGSEGVSSDSVTAFAGTVAPPEDFEITSDKATKSFTVSWNLDQYKDVMSYIDHFVVYVAADGATEEFATMDNTENSVTYKSTSLSTEYTVQVAAVTKVKNKNVPGMKSKAKTITIGAPDKVQNVVAVPGKESIVVTWDALNGDVDNYAVYLNGEEIGTKTAGEEMKITKDSLIGGREYKVTVKAANGYGTSTSDAVSATPYSNPDAPAVSDIKSANGGFSFKFADGNANGTTIEGHKLYMHDNTTETYAPLETGVTINETDKTVNVTGLANKTPYTFYLAVVGGVEVNGVKTTLESAAPENGNKISIGVPDAPANVKADAGDGRITVMFDKSDDIDGALVDEYYIKQVPNDGSVPTTVKTVMRTSAEKYSVPIDGLDNGVDYTYVVVAHNDNGESGYSQAVTATPGAPNRPEITDVKEGNKELEVTWTASKPNVEGYTVYVDGREYTSTSKTSCTINNLNNGTPYEITVKAFNIIDGNRKYSTPSDPWTATPGGVPDKVSKVYVDRTYDTETQKPGLVLTWEAPNNNGRPITGYTVTCDGVDQSNIEVSMDETTKAGTATITNLELDTTYKIDIIASNGGNGATYTTEQKTLSLPGAPEMRGASSTNRNITAKWIVPDNGGSAITEYTVYAKSLNGGDTITKVYSADSPELTYTSYGNQTIITVTINDSSFLPQAEYDVSVAAKTFAYGSEGKPSWVEIGGSSIDRNPSEPREVTLAPGNGQVLVTWKAPVDDGGKGITSYTIYAGSKEDAMGPIPGSTGTLPTVVVDPDDPDAKTKTYQYLDNNNGKGLTNGEKRYYSVYATNEAGLSGEHGYPDPKFTTPIEIGVPSWGEEGAWPTFDNVNGVSAYEVNAKWDEMTVTWNAATADEKGGTIYYDVWVGTNKVVDSTEDTSCTFGDLAENRPYSIQIYAHNDAGGAFSSPITAKNKLNVRKEEGYPYDDIYKDGIYAWIDQYYEGRETLPAGRPGVPQGFAVSMNAQYQAVGKWSAPAETGNRPIVGYNLYIDGKFNKMLRVEDLEKLNNPTSEMASHSARSDEQQSYENIVLFNMDAGAVYSVELTAVNAAPDNNESDPTKPENIGPVINLKAELDEDDIENINLTWTPVEGDNVAGYVLFGAGTPQDISYTIGEDGKAHLTYEGVINTKYNLAIAVKYTSGMVVSTSNTVTVTTGTINAPTLEKPVPSETDKGNVTLTWTAPDNADKVDLAGYLIYVNGNKVDQVNDPTATTTQIRLEEPCSVRVAGICEHYSEAEKIGIGEMSEPQTHNPKDNNIDSSIIVPKDIALVKINRDESGKVVDDENGNNVTIEWKVGDADDTHTVAATGYNIHAGVASMGSVTVPEGVTEFTQSFHLDLGEYNVAVEPTANGNAGERNSITVTVKNNYQAPTKPVVEAEVNEAKTAATVTWTPVEDGVRYELWVNGEMKVEDYKSGNNYDFSDDTYIYRFMVKAVASYDGEDVSTESEVVAKDVSTYLSNAPTVEGTLSSGTKTKVFWKAPADKLRYEVGEILEYRVYDKNSDTEIGTGTAVDGTDLYVFEIDTFANIKDSKDIQIRAYKDINGEMKISASSEEKTVTPDCNIVKDENDYLNNNISAFPDSVDRLDKDGNGVPDDSTGSDPNDPAYEIPITINVDGAVADVVEIGADGNPAKTWWEAAEIKDGKIILEKKSDDLTGKTFNLVVRKPGYTSYTVTKLPYADLANVGSMLTNVELWQGDYDNSGTIDKLDASTILTFVGESVTPELQMFDFDNSRTIDKLDASTILTFIGKTSLSVVWSNQ